MSQSPELPTAGWPDQPPEPAPYPDAQQYPGAQWNGQVDDSTMPQPVLPPEAVQAAAPTQVQPGYGGYEAEGAGLPSEFDHLFRGSPQDSRRSIDRQRPGVGAAAAPEPYQDPQFSQTPPGPPQEGQYPAAQYQAAGFATTSYAGPGPGEAPPAAYGQPEYPQAPGYGPAGYGSQGQQGQGQGQGYAGPEFGGPQYGNPEYGNPEYGNPEYGNPEYGRPEYNGPEYNGPDYGGGEFVGQGGDGSGGWGGGGARPAGNRRRWLIGGAVAAVAVIGIVYALNSGGGGSNTPTARSSKGAATTTQAATAQQQAAAVYAIISKSGQLRSDASTAVVEVTGCHDLADAQTALQNTAQQRQDQADQVGKLNVSLIQNGAQLVQKLQDAWTASAKSDIAYASIAADVQNGCKANQVKKDANYQTANSEGSSASQAKAAAAQLWNTNVVPLGQQQISDTTL
jgi:hypothetical protein